MFTQKCFALEDDLMFIAIDGNSTGKLIEKMILDNELDKLSEFSRSLQGIIRHITEVIYQMGGTIVMSGGDNVLAKLPNSGFPVVVQHLNNISIGNYRFSVAFSSTAQGAYMGLKYAKATGLFVVRADFDKNGSVRFLPLNLE